MTADQKRIKQLEKALAELLDACTELIPDRFDRLYMDGVYDPETDDALYTRRPKWESIDNARAVLPNWEPKADKE